MEKKFYENIGNEIVQNINSPVQSFSGYNFAPNTSIESDYKEIGKQVRELYPVPQITPQFKQQVDDIRNNGEKISWSNLLDFENFYKRNKQARDFGFLQSRVKQLNALWLQGTISDEQKQERKELQEKLLAYEIATQNYGILDDFLTKPNNFILQTQGYIMQGGKRASQAATASMGALSVGALTGVGTIPAISTVAGATTAGFAYGGIEEAYWQNAGEIFASLMEQKDINGNTIDEETARYIASSIGGLSAVLETIGISTGVGAFAPKIASNKLRGKVVSALQSMSIQNLLGKKAIKEIKKNIGLETVKDFVVATGAEIATEIGQEALNFGAEELGRAIQGGVYDDIHGFDEFIERAKEAGYETLATTLLPFGAGAGVKGIYRYRKSKKDTQAKESLNIISQDETIKKYPYTVQAQMKKSFDAGNDADKRYMYFQAEDIANTLFQDDEGMKLAHQLGITPESLQEAIQINTPISIETEKASTLLFANDKYKHLSENATFDPMDMTQEEINSYESQGQDFIQIADNLERLTDEAVNFAIEDVDRTELDLLADSKIEEIMEAGYSEKQAIHHAKTVAAFAQTLGKSLGISPQEFMNTYNVSGEKTYSENNQQGIFQSAPFIEKYSDRINELDNKDYGIDVTADSYSLHGKLYDELLRKEIEERVQNEINNIQNNPKRLRKYIEEIEDIDTLVDDYNEENGTELSVDEWLETEEAKSYIPDFDDQVDSEIEMYNSSRDTDDDIVQKAYDIISEAREEFLEDRLSLFEDILAEHGWTMSTEKSRQSDSTYLTLENEETGEEISEIRFSDHEDHYGSKYHIWFNESVTDQLKKLEDIINKEAEEKISFFQTEEMPFVRQGIIRKPDTETVKVVTLSEAQAPEFEHMQEFAKWAKDMLAEGGDVVIASTGETAQFSTKNVKASAKRARTKTHRDAYLALREMVENAEYDHYEQPDERHPNSGGQDVYYSALNMGGKLYSVKIKLDVLTEEQKQSQQARGRNDVSNVDYKDHKLTEIEIAPTLYHGVPKNRQSMQEVSAISDVSLGVIRGNVKPSKISDNT